MSTTTAWFATKNNEVLHHALFAETGTARCNSGIKPRFKDDGTPAAELPDHAQLCSRCRHKLSAPAVDAVAEEAKPEQAEKPKKLTATQMWGYLTLLQREQVLAWFVATYAPSRNAARFQLTKSPALTHAESLIAEKWEGMQS